MKKTVLWILWLGLLPALGLGSGLQDQLAAESERREKTVRPLQQALDQGQQLAKQGETLRAWEGLVQVWQQTPESLQETSLGQQVRRELSVWELDLGEGEGLQSRWPKAREWALRALQHNPNNSGAHSLLEKADAILRRGAVSGEEVNPALTNRFFEKLQGVRDGLKEAEELRETGQLDRAEVRYEEVLRLDPFNAVATEEFARFMKNAPLSPASPEVSPIWSGGERCGKLGIIFIPKKLRGRGARKSPGL